MIWWERRVSVIIPSRQRVAQVRECVERLWATVRGYDVECIVVADGDMATAQALDGVASRTILLPMQCGALQAWNTGASLATGAVLVLGADDLWWFHGWIGEMLEVMAQFPNGDGMVGLNDLAHDGNKISTHFGVSRQCAIEHFGGCLVTPVYRHYYVDQEAAARAKRAGRFAWAQNAVAEHLHPVFGKARMDAVYEWPQASLEADGELFFKRAAAGWPDDFEPVLQPAVG